MSVVVVKADEIRAVVKKQEVTIIYTRHSGKFVCEPTEPKQLKDGSFEYQLKARRS